MYGRIAKTESLKARGTDKLFHNFPRQQLFACTTASSRLILRNICLILPVSNATSSFARAVKWIQLFVRLPVPESVDVPIAAGKPKPIMELHLSNIICPLYWHVGGTVAWASQGTRHVATWLHLGYDFSNRPLLLGYRTAAACGHGGSMWKA